MSRENVELTYRAHDAFNRRDIEEWRNGKPVRYRAFQGEVEALEAVGLRE